MKRVLRVVTFALVPVATFVACGSRGPLDDDITPIVVDSGVADVVAVDQDAPVVDSGPPDTGFDAGQGPIQCAQCVGQTCGTDIATCLQDTSCRDVFQCVITTCIGGGGGGGIDPSCLTGCTGGGGPGVGEALGVFQCITNDCGNPCGCLLGGLGGFGGGGGG
ncbi:MAG: hypothetical protein ACREJX_03260 [Polyangiaceae bacterium]